MNEPNELWNQLAQRGTPRGADVVVQAAAMAATSPTTATLGAVVNDQEIPAIEMTPNVANRRSRSRRGFGALGLAALLGVGGFATLAVQGDGGGAGSPKEAVEQLANAINKEDILAAVDIMAPNEVRSLHKTVDKAQQKAADEELVKTASKPLAGLDLDVKNLTTTVESLADGYAKVKLTGTIHAQTDSADFGRMLRNATNGDNTNGDIDISDVRIGDTDPFVMAVRDGDGWYISPAYTGLEYARVASDLPAADFGSSSDANLGANTPEDAANEMLRAISAHDWTKVASLVPPNEFPLYDYRAAFAQLMNDSLGRDSFSITSVASTAKVDGNEATVSVEASGTTDGGDKWEISKSCLKLKLSDGEAIGFSRDCILATDVIPFIGYGRFGGGFGYGNQSANIDEWASLQASERDGRWFVSPVGSVINSLEDLVKNMDHDALAELLNQPMEITSSGAITLGTGVAVPKASGTKRYTLTVDKPETVVSRTSNYNAYVEIFDATGRRVESSYDSNAESFEETWNLQPKVEYSVVFRNYGPQTTVAIWRQADAPEQIVPEFRAGSDGSSGSVTDGEFCETAGGTTTCSQTTNATTKFPPTTVMATQP